MWQVVTKNGIIQKQQHDLLELESTLARKPGPEISEKLNAHQNDARKKSKQIKAMTSELNMHQGQVNEYKREIDRLTAELHNFKKKYFEQKLREVEREPVIKPMRDKSNTTKTRFVGGGFAIK